MKTKTLVICACSAVIGLAAVLASMSVAQQPQDGKVAAADDKGAGGNGPAMKLPPGWTEDDMKACMIAGTPGKMQEHLVKSVGEWKGKSSMWMPGATEPMQSECTLTVTSLMDGRYTKAETKGEMPGMGPYHGVGLYGFDNVSQQFVSTWIDNQSTGMMNGTGTLSADGKTLTWKCTFSCPITKKPAIMREIETTTGPDTKTLEMYGADPKSGKEFKMMQIDFTKKS